MKTYKLILLLSYICIASFSAAIITPALPVIGASFHLSHGALEWVISIFLLGYVFGQLIYAPLANRFNALFALRLGLCINLVGLILCILAASLHLYTLLLLGRLVTALGASAGLCCTFMLIHALLDEHQKHTALSYSIVSFTLGIGGAVLIGGLVTQYWHWQICFWILLIHGLLMLISTYLFQVSNSHKQALNIASLLKSYLHSLQSSTLVRYAYIVGIASIVGYTFSAAGPLIADHYLQLNPSQYGIWNLINMIGMVASGLLSKPLLKRYEPRNIILVALVCLLLCIASLCVFAFMHSQLALWFFITTMGLYLFSGLLFPAASYYASHAIADKASASSMMSFINMASAMLAVIVLGYLPLSSLVGFILVLSAASVLGLALVSFKRS